MAKQQPVALVFAGPVSRGSLGRLPGLRQALAWVKSSSIATASRAVHALHEGRAVAHYADLEEASIILVSVPEHAIKGTVDALAESCLTWQHKTVVLFDTCADSSALEPLAVRGAETATLLFHARPEQFLCEGSTEALRAVRRLTGTTTLLVLRDKAAYFRAVDLTTAAFYPLFSAAVDAFCSGGMTKSEAEKTTAAMIAESARTFLRAGKRLLKRAAKP
ncbi:MAG: hypothetical protein SGI92_27545 [Bryobacteraceae bacterium]|nr:hypothetical protein [Bryobacteraceae bacterium]